MARQGGKFSTVGNGVAAPLPRFTEHDVIGFLLDHQAELSRSHGKIARVILEHPTGFVEKPIEELVGWIGVSAPTITRFSRVIGCDGLRDLKLKVMSSMRVGARYLEPVTPPATLAEVSQRVVMRGQRAILEAQRSIDMDQLDRAIDLLTRSRMIYAFGSGGVLQQFAEPMTIYRQPANLFVAAFIGSPRMNFLAGPDAPGGHGRDRVVGVRPFDLSPAVAGADGFRLAGELALIEPAGPVHYLDVQVGAMMIKATCADPTGLSPGTPLTVSAPSRCLHVFDRDSGVRLAS